MEDHESYDVPTDAASHEPLFDPKKATSLIFIEGTGDSKGVTGGAG